MSSQDFLREYAAESPKIVGIPGFEMNKPLSVNTLADIGIELEIEGRTLPSQGYLDKIKAESGARWLVKADGSLRGEAFEYVLSTPCRANEVEYLLKTLWEVFDTLKTRFTLSNRCSSHVHINMNGYKINQLTSIIALWTAFEEVLINWCGEERKTNHFCLSSKDTDALIESWNRGLQGENFHRNLGEGYKYLALNVRPLWEFGSFEFRCMRASQEYRPILDWALFINALCKYAAEVYTNPMLFSNDLSERSGRSIFYDICERAAVSDTFIEEVLGNTDNGDFDRLVLNGFRRAQSLVMGHPWYDWMDLINKVYVPSPFGKKKGIDPGLIDHNFEIRRNPVAGRRLREFINAEPAPAPVPVAPAPVPVAPAPRARAVPERRDREPLLSPWEFTAAENYDQYRIDPDLPIEFVDGTPAVVTHYTPGSRHVGVRATVPYQVEEHDFEETYSYNLNTGWWTSDASINRIRNVGSMPVVTAGEYRLNQAFERIQNNIDRAVGDILGDEAEDVEF